jgi:hypothetical protein
MKTAMNLMLGALLLLSTRAATAPSIRMDHAGNGGRPAAQGFTTLPLAAQASISAALGRDLASYQIRSQEGGLQSGNARHQLAAEFTATGVAVHHGGESIRLALQGYGYAGDLTPVRDVVPTPSDNRVEYHRGPLTEWYVNGPAGLEQGFTLAAPPNRAKGQRANKPLQIALSLSGDFAVTADQGQRGLTLTARDQDITMQYAGLTATDAAGKELPAWLELRGKQLLLEVADNTARYPLTIDPVFQVAKLTASDGTFSDRLGIVAISGNTVVAGAPEEEVGHHKFQGALYVFVKPTTGWANMTQIAKLTASDGAVNDLLGSAVAINGNTVVAGSYFANSSQGAAYVFVQPESGWTDMTETAKLTASDGASSDFLGDSVAVSGNIVVAGAYDARIGAHAGQGAAYVFVRPESGWTDMTQTAKLTASDGEFQDYLGIGVSASGDTVVAGAPNEEVGHHKFQGALYVFVKPTSGWRDMTQTAKLTTSDGGADDSFGGGSISGDTVVAGAAQAKIGTNNAQGAAYVFVRPKGGWANMTETAKLTASDGAAFDELGVDASISGNMVIAGAPFRSIHGNSRQGAAYVFLKPANGWVNATQSAKLIASDGTSNDYLGFSVSVDDDTAVAGAPAPLGGNPGAAYVFLP